MKKIVTYSFILLALPFFYAQAVTVKNSVSASANSGGNVAEEGQVVEGKAVSEVNVTTTIDGNVVEDIHHADESDATASVEVTTVAGNSAAASQVEVKVGGVTRSIKQPSERGTTTTIDGTSGTTTFETHGSAKNTARASGLKTIISNVWKKLKYVFSFNWI